MKQHFSPALMPKCGHKTFKFILKNKIGLINCPLTHTSSKYIHQYNAFNVCLLLKRSEVRRNFKVERRLCCSNLLAEEGAVFYAKQN